MGTRGAFGYKYQGEEYFIHRGSDAYPDGLGAEIIRYIRKYSIDEMREVVKKLDFVRSDEIAPRGSKTKFRRYTYKGIGSYSDKEFRSTWRGILSKLYRSPTWIKGVSSTLGEYHTSELKVFAYDEPNYPKRRLGASGLDSAWDYLIDLDEGLLYISTLDNIQIIFNINSIPKDWRRIIYDKILPMNVSYHGYDIDEAKHVAGAEVFGYRVHKKCFYGQVDASIRFDRFEGDLVVHKCEHCSKETVRAIETFDKI